MRHPTRAGDGSDPGDEIGVAVVLTASSDLVPFAQDRLAEAGLTVGPASGPTFWVEGSADTFEEVFGARPVAVDDGGWATQDGDELPLTALAADLQEALVAVAFERPAELHDGPAGLPDGPAELPDHQPEDLPGPELDP